MITSENIERVLGEEIMLMRALRPDLKELTIQEHHYNMLLDSLDQEKLDVYGGYRVCVIPSSSS